MREFDPIVIVVDPIQTRTSNADGQKPRTVNPKSRVVNQSSIQTIAAVDLSCMDENKTIRGELKK